MCIIDDGERCIRQSDHLQATRHRLNVRKCVDRILQGHVGAHEHPEHAEQVCRIESADQTAAQERRTPRGGDFEFQATGGKVQTMAGDIGLAESVAEHVDARSVNRFHELATEPVIDVDDRMLQVRQLEELRLGGAIVFHGLVIVEVVARKIREQRHIELDAVDAPLVDAVRRHLHGATSCAASTQRGQPQLQRNRIRRGIDRDIQFPGKSASQRADHGSLASKPRHRLRDPVGAGCLAVGTGHPRQPHVA